MGLRERTTPGEGGRRKKRNRRIGETGGDEESEKSSAEPALSGVEVEGPTEGTRCVVTRVVPAERLAVIS